MIKKNSGRERETEKQRLWIKIKNRVKQNPGHWPI